MFFEQYAVSSLDPDPKWGRENNPDIAKRGTAYMFLVSYDRVTPEGED